jgi:hypothetical protein
MAFDLSTGDDVRGATIRSGLRGYHKDDVDEFRASVAELVDDLRRRADVASGHLAQLGLDEPLDLKQEFATVGREVSAILEAARTAATDIRQRATADGERWRREAEDDAARMRTEAWEEASAHLEASVGEAQQTRASADEDALFIRAQAEKEGIRLTSEAKRDAEESIRTARAEADAIIADARETAEAAQERTRALEVRRDELMKELESARRAIGAVEDEIEEQQEKLLAPETTTVRIIDQGGDASTSEKGWLDEDATVRLVPGQTRPAPMSDLEPVLDADDIVAEVERLQIEPSVADPWPERPETRKIASLEPPAESAASVEVEEPPGEEDVAESSPVEPQVEAPSAQAGETAQEPETSDGASADDGADIAGEQPVAVDASNGSVSGAPDGLGDLFASLRSPETVEPPDASTPVHAATPETPPSSEPSVGQTTEETEETEGTEPPPVDRDAATVQDDEHDQQEAAVLPVTNRSLRLVKKQILEFQNAMLEATKADPDGWRPDAEEYRLALDPHVHALIDEVHRAADGEGASEVTAEFGAALAAAVSKAADTMAGSGYRETSASLGRVFRSWRSDEAERRLTDVAAAAYRGAASTAIRS